MTAAEMDIIVGANVDQAVASFKKLGIEINKTEKQATKTTQKAGKDFTGLSRIIQDLPYGFQGISNNLTNILPAAGAAGLAISAITTAISFAQIGFSNWTRGISGNKEELKEHTKQVDESTKAAADSLAKVSLLISQSQSLRATDGQRKKILEELNTISSEYFGNLKLEHGEVKGLVEAYNAYAENILKVARAKGVSSKIESLTQDFVTLRKESERIDKGFENLSLTARTASAFLRDVPGANAFERIQNAATKVTKILNAEYIPSFQDIAYLAEITGQSERQVNEILSKRQYLKTKEARVMAQIATYSQLVADVELGRIKADKEKQPKPVPIPLVNAFIKGRNKYDKEIAIETGDIMGKVQKELDKNPIQFRFKPPELSDEEKKRIQEFTNMVGGIVQSGFEAVGETLGNILSGKNNPFSAIFDFLGSSLIKLGSYVIAASELLSKVTASLTAALSGFGGAGIAVGIGLIALGVVLKNIPKFATGGVVTSPTLAMVGEQGPERITPLGYEGRANTVMQIEGNLIVSGNDLRAVLRRANNSATNTW